MTNDTAKDVVEKAKDSKKSEDVSDLDRPSSPDEATAIDEHDGKRVRGWENGGKPE